MSGDIYNVTLGEKEKILKKYFPDETERLLRTLILKEKQRFVVFQEIVKRFNTGKIYNEKKVNEIIKTAYSDYVTARRFLIEYGFMDRKPDRSQYWLK